MGEDGGGLGGKGALESSKVEFLLNMFEKAVAFSRGVVAIEESGSIKGGVEELEKLLEMFFVRDHRSFVLFDSERPAHFRLMKARLAPLSLAFERFRAEIKFLWEFGEGFCFQARCALSLRRMASATERSNHLAEDEDFWIQGIKHDIPAPITSAIDSATSEGPRPEKHEVLQGKSRKKDLRSVHWALPNFQMRRLEEGRGGGCAHDDSSEMRL